MTVLAQGAEGSLVRTIQRRVRARRRLASRRLRAETCATDATDGPPTGDVPFIIYLCCGHRRAGDVADQLKGTIQVVCVDVHCDANMDLTRVETVDWLTELAQMDFCLGVIATPPCSTFSAARFKQPGPRVERDIDNPGGIAREDGLPSLNVLIHNVIIHACLRIMGAAAEHGGFGFFENPPARREGSQHRGRSLAIQGRERHACMFDYEPVVTFTEAHDMRDTVWISVWPAPSGAA